MVEPILLGIGIPIGVFILSGLKVVNHYERGVKFTLGKYSGIMKDGLRLVIPILQSWERVDLRTKVIDVPDQEAMTKDNVSVNINAVLYFKVSKSETAILEVNDYHYAVSQLAQTTMRDVVGEVSLDDLLTKRDAVSKRIQQIVDIATDPWGIKVEGVILKHIELPADMKRVMAKEAEAEREKRATIIKASGEVTAATNMAKAALQLATTPGALHLRTLHSVNDLSSDKSFTEIHAIPMEVIQVLGRLGLKK